jgi:DNA-binding NarL/FixJ family response regulator
VESRNRSRAWYWHDAAVKPASTADAQPVRVAVVDDHPVVAAAIAAAAASRATSGEGRPIDLVGTARTLAEAEALVRRKGPDAPDVVLCDVQLEAGTDGLSVVDAAVAAGRRAIVLTSFDRSSIVRAAFEHGASGFLAKGADVADIIDAIRIVASGGSAFSAASLDAARWGLRPPSGREMAVLQELYRGATSEEIGTRLGISGRTVESHLRRLFDRYGVLSRTELAILALREGWIAAEV